MSENSRPLYLLLRYLKDEDLAVLVSRHHSPATAQRAREKRMRTNRKEGKVEFLSIRRGIRSAHPTSSIGSLLWLPTKTRTLSLAEQTEVRDATHIQRRTP